ncbi:hypothetical protein K437DRAFT_257218 [Tilletiaria anomala UBC 951]|uniref:Uncharacterized protein n=1 Tax=Tilletiaria anomala (strain ATCC 24038 / CBS 436.72 / UBC 951) TaxID=1037660 RepID=A0A066VRG6_TILAU|nr:uncharacterized protein K437DRAFT_257218 [Tilletiaria anomala UBC 951]KDN44081.1 hypothetical protein K437DRAFT_257218 [Tilletiaria anomala UBC 951]
MVDPSFGAEAISDLLLDFYIVVLGLVIASLKVDATSAMAAWEQERALIPKCSESPPWRPIIWKMQKRHASDDTGAR